MHSAEYFITANTNYIKHGVTKMVTQKETKMEKENVTKNVLSNENGFTFVEMMGVIVVMLIGIGVAVAGVNSLMGSSKLSNAQTEITTVVMKTKQAFANSPTTTGLTNDVAESLGIFPDNIKANKQNPWGGDYTLAPAADPTRFTLTVDGVPQDRCSGLALFQKGGFEEVKINAASLTQATATAVTAATACSLDSNTLVYTVLK